MNNVIFKESKRDGEGVVRDDTIVTIHPMEKGVVVEFMTESHIDNNPMRSDVDIVKYMHVVRCVLGELACNVLKYDLSNPQSFEKLRSKISSGEIDISDFKYEVLSRADNNRFSLDLYLPMSATQSFSIDCYTSTSMKGYLVPLEAKFNGIKMPDIFRGFDMFNAEDIIRNAYKTLIGEIDALELAQYSRSFDPTGVKSISDKIVSDEKCIAGDRVINEPTM